MALFHVDCVFRVSREGFPDSLAQMTPATPIDLHQRVKHQLHWLRLMTRPGHRCFTDPDYNWLKFISLEFALDSKGLWAKLIPIYHYNLQCVIYSKVSMEKMQGMLTSWSLLFFSNILWLNRTCFLFSCRRSRGACETEGRLRWCLRIWILSTHTWQIHRHHHLGRTAHSQEVSISWTNHISQTHAAITFKARATSHTRPLRSEKSDQMQS